MQATLQYRDALIETAVYLNAAITAYDVQREIKQPSTSETRVVYGALRPGHDQSVSRFRPRKGCIAVSPIVPDGPRFSADLRHRDRDAEVLGRRLF